MRSYLVDEITPEDMEKIADYLRDAAISSSLEKIYWLEVPHDLLSGPQFAHTHCQPHVFAVELGSNWIRLEFYSRSLTGVRCSCQGYSTEPQSLYIIRFAHEMLDNLGINT